MITILTTIKALVPENYAFVLRGEPLNEEDFKSMYRPITGADEDNTAIEETDSTKWTITWADIVAKKAQLEKEYTDNEYQRKRTGIDGTTDGYPPIGEQLDYIYHNGIDKWKTDMVDPVKAKYPKPS